MDSPQDVRWRTQVGRWLLAPQHRYSTSRVSLFVRSQWRGILFGLLATYALGATVYLLAGGGGPAMTSLVAMEAEVEGRTATGNSATGDTAVDVSSPAVTALTQPAVAPIDCSSIDPATHSEDARLDGVHALGFATLDDLPAAFAGYQGCPLIVNFFASWCVPCVAEMPDFQQFWVDHGAEVAVLGLAFQDPPQQALATVADRGVTYPTGMDDRELFIDFGGLGMPTTVFVSPDGEILETHSGLLTLADIISRATEHYGL